MTPQEFKEAFDAAFLINRKHLLWDSAKSKTACMTAYIYRTIADSFYDLEIEHEHKGIDAVLYRNSMGKIISHDKVEVAIDHENDVRSIGKELWNFAQHDFPLNVLITYTAEKEKHIITPHSEIMNKITSGNSKLMVILYPEHGWPGSYKARGDRIRFGYYTYENETLNPVL
jgi:hypothetical protein